MSDSLRILFFDMNSYFASVVQAEEPALLERPVGVVTTLAPGAACIAASIEAKRCGVGMGVRMAEAKRLCPDIVFRPAKHDVFVAYHHRIRQAVERIIPIETAWSVDEFSCRLMGREQGLEQALQLGRDIQAALLREVSPALRCSVGVAPNKLLAKIAAELEKPLGLNVLQPADLPRRIAHLSLRDLPGISKRMSARLGAAGVESVTQLYALDPKQARHIWGSVEGERVLRQLRGEMVVYPRTQRRTVGHGQMLTPANRTPEGARLVARRLLVKAGARLRREGRVARSLQVSCKTRAGRRLRAEGGIKPTQDTVTLLAVFERYWARLAVVEPISVAIMLGGLQAASEEVTDLFDLAADATAKNAARLALCFGIDALNQKFGQDTVRFGELPPHKVAYTGAKIAFQRVPEREEFRE